MRLRCALLLLHALSAAALAGVRAASEPASCSAAVPRDVGAWPSSPEQGPHTLSPALRGRLARATIAAFTPDAWTPLLAKLRRGEAITVLAVGSSIVAGHAGTYISNASVLRAAGVQALMPPFQRLLDETGSARTNGYLSQFMAAINATWPHPGHLVLNIGRGAVNLGMFLDVMCTERLLPLAAPVDLLLFESHNEDGAAGHEGDPGRTTVEQMERLHTFLQSRLAHGPRSIPVVMLSVLPLIQGFEGSTPRLSNKELCAGDRGMHCAEPSCPADVHTAGIFARSALGGTEACLATAARHYGWALITTHDATAAGLRDGLHIAANISECEWGTLFYSDPIHPSWRHGTNLIADALLSLLIAAQDVMPPGCGAVNDTASLPPVSRLPTPISEHGRTVTPHSCLDADHIAPTRNDSWFFVRHEVVKGAIVWKEGWVANTSGAVLEFPFRTRLVELPPAARARLTVRILTSYEGMGAARLACLSGCACEPTVLEGHVNGSVSVEYDAHVPVTQAAQCTLQLRVLDETRSGGHKVKLLGVTLGALPPPPPAPSRRRRRA